MKLTLDPRLIQQIFCKGEFSNEKIVFDLVCPAAGGQHAVWLQQ